MTVSLTSKNEYIEKYRHLNVLSYVQRVKTNMEKYTYILYVQLIKLNEHIYIIPSYQDLI